MKDKVIDFIKKNKKTVIIIAIVIALLAFIIIIANNKSEIGNTSSNLSNLGFSVENNGWVYYLGIKDDNNDGIYRVKEKGKKIEKISDSSGILMNKSSKYIYYLDTENYDIIKMKANGKDKETVVKDVDMKKITVIDNWIYYFKDSKFYRESIVNDEKQIISNKTIGNYQIEDKWIYYSYIENEKYTVAKMRINGKDNEIIENDLSENFFVKNNKLYYIYENYDENKMEYNYELYTIKTNGKNKEKIADFGKNIQIENVNFYKDKIFYVKENDDGLRGIYSVNINGKKEKKIVDLNGYYTLINVNNDWIYYTDQDENMNSQMYRIKLNGKNKQDLSLKQ